MSPCNTCSCILANDEEKSFFYNIDLSFAAKDKDHVLTLQAPISSTFYGCNLQL